MAALCRPIYCERKCCEMCGEVFPARIPAHYSDDLNALTMHMMEEDLIMRPTAEWLEHHVFFAGNSHLWEQEYGECDKMNRELEKLRAEGAAEKMRYLKRQLEFLRGWCGHEELTRAREKHEKMCTPEDPARRGVISNAHIIPILISHFSVQSHADDERLYFVSWRGAKVVSGRVAGRIVFLYLSPRCNTWAFDIIKEEEQKRDVNEWEPY